MIKGNREKDGISALVNQRLNFEDRDYGPSSIVETLMPRTSSVTVQMMIKKKMEKEMKKEKE